MAQHQAGRAAVGMAPDVANDIFVLRIDIDLLPNRPARDLRQRFESIQGVPADIRGRRLRTWPIVIPPSPTGRRLSATHVLAQRCTRQVRVQRQMPGHQQQARVMIERQGFIDGFPLPHPLLRLGGQWRWLRLRAGRRGPRRIASTHRAPGGVQQLQFIAQRKRQRQAALVCPPRRRRGRRRLHIRDGRLEKRNQGRKCRNMGA